MKKYNNLIIFLLITVGRTMFLVMTKFFLWSYLKDFRSLEEIAGFLSLGTMLAFFVG
jgi:hypothetical protein